MTVPVHIFPKSTRTESTMTESNTAQATIEFESELPMSEGIQFLAVADLHESPTNPRKTFAGLDGLAESMKRSGVMQSLLVRDLGGPAGYEVVAGARRLRAARLAGLHDLPCDVRELSDAQVIEVQLTENLQRQDLTALEEAEGYESLRARGWTPVQISQKTGKSRETVYARLKLLALGPEGRQAVADGRLQASVAVRLARIPTHELQATALRDLLDEGDVPSRFALEALTQNYCRPLSKAPFDTKDDLLTDAGPCSRCPKNSRNGTPGLFDDLPSQAGEHCTDVLCYGRKAEAAWTALATLESAKGLRVLSLAEGAKVFQPGSGALPMWGSEWVALDGPCHADPKQRTWRELLSKLPAAERPEEVLCPDRNHQGHRLVDRKAATKALGEAGAKWAEPETDKAIEARKKAKAAAKKKPADNLEPLVLVDVAKRIGEEAKKVCFVDAEWERLARFLLDAFEHRPTLFDATGLKDFPAIEKDIGRSSGAELRGLCALMLTLHAAGEDDELTSEVLALAKARKVDLAALRKSRELAAAVEVLQGEKKKAKKSNAKKGAK